jgi:catechol 2,3-dioxygenase-like lactoylglutathione lyase family enzyme
MATLNSLTLGVDDPAAAGSFYRALGVDQVVRVQAADEATSGFRGYTLSLVVAQPGVVDAYLAAALDGGATSLKPAKKSLWGYGGVVQAPDGAIWKVATSAKKDKGPSTREYDDLVLLLGVTDVRASKQFYVDRGLSVAKSFGGKYVEFDPQGSAVKLAIYPRRAAAKDAGVPPEGTGSHRLVVGGDLGDLTDPDGFAWEMTAVDRVG